MESQAGGGKDAAVWPCSGHPEGMGRYCRARLQASAGWRSLPTLSPGVAWQWPAPKENAPSDRSRRAGMDTGDSGHSRG